jgi:glycosyltransferase involved in cell wall biosynthesis
MIQMQSYTNDYIEKRVNLNQEKLISICILSYNQVKEIERLLLSIIDQYTNELEIIIRDDSTDNKTDELVKKYRQSIPIKYFSGLKEGIDNTVIFLTRKATGRFIWWMGDDTIEPGGIAEVLNIIKTKPTVDFIWANYQLFNTKIMAIDINLKGCNIDKNELLKLGGAGLGFISSTIFKKEIGMNALSEAENYIGSLFSNLYIILFVISKSEACYYLRGPIVICHPTTSEEIKKLVIKENGEIINRGFEVYGITFPAIVKRFSKDFKSSVIEKVIKISFRQTWRGIYVGWIGGWDTPHGKKAILFKNYWRHPSAYLAIVLFSLPVSINKKLYILYKFARDIKIFK